MTMHLLNPLISFVFSIKIDETEPEELTRQNSKYAVHNTD